MNSSSLTLPSLRRIIFYINEEITFCHCAKGDFITKKGDTMGYISTIKTAVQLFPFLAFC